MKSYHGNDRPYIYLAYSKEDDVSDILKLLEDNNIAVCLSEPFDRKEKKRIEAAYGVALIVSENMRKDPCFRKVLDCAVASDKNILSIYKEPLELDAVSHMQLDPQQALFAYDYKDKETFNAEILKSVIFRDMKITSQQKRFQRNRSLAMIIVPIIAAIILYVAVIYPLLIVPSKAEEKEKEQFGLAGLSDEDLAKIISLQIVGDKVFADPEEINKVSVSCDPDDPDTIYYSVELINDGDWTWGESGVTHPGSIEDISILKKMPNLKRLTIAGEKISDISPICELKKLEELVINANPIESLEGLENCTSLKRIELRNTLVSDLSPLYKGPSLEGIWAGNCSYIIDISGFENTTMNCLELYGSPIREIKHLPKTSMFGLNLAGDFDDYSFLLDPLNYNWLMVGDDMEKLQPYINQIDVYGDFSFAGNIRELRQLEGLGLHYTLELHDCEWLMSIEGIGEMFPELEELTLRNCPDLHDLTPVLESNIKRLNITDEYADLVTDEFYDKGIEVNINE